MATFNEEDIDFSDLEQMYQTNPDTGMETFVVVDGAPIVPESKVETLTKVLKKLFSESGKIKKDGFYMPMGDDGKSKGFIFIEYENGQDAVKAIQQYHLKKLDKRHTLLVNKLGDVERYGFAGNVATEYKEPELPPYQERGHLRSYMADPQGRDQFLLQKGRTVEVSWFKKSGEPVADGRQMNTSTFTRWSPKGTYIVTFHIEGVQLRGTNEWVALGRFPHQKPEFVDFSPNEKFLATFSKSPIVLPPIDDPARVNCPFKEQDEGNNVVVWDVKTGLPLRSFYLEFQDPKRNPQAKKMWPMFKWSPDDKYFGRINNPDGKSGNEVLQIFESSTMGLVDKKSIKTPGIVDFEFSPTPVLLESQKEPTNVLSYWTPEMENQTARVTIMEIPTKTVIRTRNMFNVSECQLYWQDMGRFLCVKVDRHTKTKKSTYTNLEFFSLNEKSVPVEVTELKETVINFAWEPKGDRYSIISRPDGSAGPVLAASGATVQNRNTVSFYALEKNKGIQGTWRLLNKYEKKNTNSLFWSPKGRFLITADVGGTTAVELDFYDFDHEGGSNVNEKTGKKDDDLPCNLYHIGQVEHFGMTDLQWDPSGRFVASWSSCWRHATENGYKIWDFRGQLLKSEQIDQFGTFLWRPRPESRLTKEEKKKITKNLKKYSRKFDEDDAMEASEANRELIMKRRNAWDHWQEWRAEMDNKLESIGLLNEKQLAEPEEGDEFIEEITEEILEEKEEVLE